MMSAAWKASASPFMRLFKEYPAMKRIIITLTCAALLAACATNPVTGRKQFIIVSESQAIAASKEAYVQMLRPLEKEGKIDKDPALKKRIDTITGKLVAQAIRFRPETAQWEWQVKVIDDPKTVNAFCMAGGRMAVYTGLIQQVKPTDDELAEVMGHEIAHALSNHTAEKMSVALATDLAVTAVAITQHQSALALTGTALAAAIAIKLPNSRQAESEADRIGIELAARAGYDPHAAVTLWQKMEKVAGGGRIDFLSTHPAPKKRMETLNRLVSQMMPYYEEKGERPSYKLKDEGL
jgi:predicted Zn-dependent protease